MGKARLQIKTFRTSDTPEQLSTTLKLIGQGIQSGALYMPIRHLAARAATKAPPKDYPAQIKAVYDAITRWWWRYTYDPQGAEVLTLDGPRIYSLTLGSGSREHKGYGDCDDIATAAGALLRSIGMDVRIATTAPPGSPYIFTHVFIQAKPPKARQWINFDPVLYPARPLGSIATHGRIAFWNLAGRLLSFKGQFPPRFKAVMSRYGIGQAETAGNISPSGQIGKSDLMGTFLNTRQALPRFEDFADYSDSIGFFGEAIDENDPIHMRRILREDVLPSFDRVGLLGFGCYSGMMGSLTGEQLPHIMAEYDGTDEIGNTGLVRTKHFELSPDDYAVVQSHGVPMVGALALADDGEVYRWTANPDGLGGFFKKLFKKARKAIKKVAGKVKGVIKKVVTKTKFGKKLWKIGSKIHATAMKITKGLLKKIGPIAKRIAPIAALIPGIGPAVAGGLMITGKVYDIANKVGVKFDKDKKPIINSKAQGAAFSKMLAAEGRKMGKGRAENVLSKFKAMKQRQRGQYGIAPMFRGSEPADFVTMGEVYSDPRVCPSGRMPSAPIGWF